MKNTRLLLKEHGAVLISAVIMLMLIAMFSTSAMQSSTISVAQAANQTAATDAFQVAQNAFSVALSQSRFLLNDEINFMTSQTLNGADARATLRHLGSSKPIPHPEFNPVAHAHLQADYFELTTAVQAPRFVSARFSLFFYIVRRTSDPDTEIIAGTPDASADFSYSPHRLSWRVEHD